MKLEKIAALATVTHTIATAMDAIRQNQARLKEIENEKIECMKRIETAKTIINENVIALDNQFDIDIDEYYLG